MSEEHVKYFDAQIQSTLEQLSRAIEGKVIRRDLDKICLEIRILKDAREHFVQSKAIENFKKNFWKNP